MGRTLPNNGPTNEWNLEFKEGTNLFIPGIGQVPSLMIPIPATQTIRIVLDPTYFEEINSTQEIAGQLIVHELMHGFMYVYKDVFDFDDPLDFQNHEIMFKECVNSMRDILKKYYNLSTDDAIALALQGMDDFLLIDNNGSTSYKTDLNEFAIEHYGIDLAGALIIHEKYFDGIKCRS